jgi:hypothetical protein
MVKFLSKHLGLSYKAAARMRGQLQLALGWETFAVKLMRAWRALQVSR